MAIRLMRRLASALPLLTSRAAPKPRAESAYVMPVRLMHPMTRPTEPNRPAGFGGMFTHDEKAKPSAANKEDGPRPGDSRDEHKAAIDDFKDTQRRVAAEKRKEEERAATDTASRTFEKYKADPTGDHGLDKAILKVWREVSPKDRMPDGVLSAREVWELVKQRESPPAGSEVLFRGMLQQGDIDSLMRGICEYRDIFKAPVPTATFNELLEYCVERDGPEHVKIGLDLLSVMNDCGSLPDDRTLDLSDSLNAFFPFEDNISENADAYSTKLAEKKSRAREEEEAPPETVSQIITHSVWAGYETKTAQRRPEL